MSRESSNRGGEHWINHPVSRLLVYKPLKWSKENKLSQHILDFASISQLSSAHSYRRTGDDEIDDVTAHSAFDCKSPLFHGTRSDSDRTFCVRILTKLMVLFSIIVPQIICCRGLSNFAERDLLSTLRLRSALLDEYNGSIVAAQS